MAVVGGFSFAISQFDRAMQAKRQPGSSFKPLVYAAALDNGYKPTSIVLDAPIEIEQGPGKEVWKPENYDKDAVARPLDAARRHREVAQPDDGAARPGHGHAADRRVFQALRRLRRSAAGARHVARRRRDDAAAAWRRPTAMLANGGKQVRATLIDRIQDRWGQHGLAPRRPRVRRLQGARAGRTSPSRTSPTTASRSSTRTPPTR